MLNKFTDNFLNLLFPPRCPACDGIVTHIGPCKACAPKFIPIAGAVCALCGQPVASDDVEFCKNCEDMPRFFDGGTAAFKYKDIASSVLRFKNNGRAQYGQFFAGQMVQYLGENIARWKPDAIIPIPLSDKKYKARGYNQAQILAKPLAKKLNIPLMSDMMLRNETHSDQKKLNLKQRVNNITGAFKMTENSVQLSKVVLIDDVYTTGATLNEAASCLKQHHVQKVYFAVLASGE